MRRPGSRSCAVEPRLLPKLRAVAGPVVGVRTANAATERNGAAQELTSRDTGVLDAGAPLPAALGQRSKIFIALIFFSWKWSKICWETGRRLLFVSYLGFWA